MGIRLLQERVAALVSDDGARAGPERGAGSSGERDQREYEQSKRPNAPDSAVPGALGKARSMVVGRVWHDGVLSFLCFEPITGRSSYAPSTAPVWLFAHCDPMSLSASSRLSAGYIDPCGVDGISGDLLNAEQHPVAVMVVQGGDLEDYLVEPVGRCDQLARPNTSSGRRRHPQELRGQSHSRRRATPNRCSSAKSSNCLLRRNHRANRSPARRPRPTSPARRLPGTAQRQLPEHTAGARVAEELGRHLQVGRRFDAAAPTAATASPPSVNWLPKIRSRPRRFRMRRMTVGLLRARLQAEAPPVRVRNAGGNHQGVGRLARGHFLPSQGALARHLRAELFQRSP